MASSNYTVVDTSEAVRQMLVAIKSSPTVPPSLYIDLEGINLSRKGSISILQIFHAPQRHTYLVDIHVLQNVAFSTQASTGETLKSVLESPAIPKVIFDIRNDSDALFSHYGIRVAGIQDLQLMELATRSGQKEFISGLAKCIQYDAQMSSAEQAVWALVKDDGVRMFAPERGGSYEVFNIRPLSDKIKAYCVQDVQFLPRLWQVYNRRMTPTWKSRVEQATKDRISESQSPNYVGQGQHKVLAPPGWSSFGYF